MIEATITLKLTKDHEVIKKGVTPMEALLLTAEFHRLVGGNPIEVHAGTSVEAKVEDVDKDGKPVLRARTDNEELMRLRGKYHAKKVLAATQATQGFPKTFDEAMNIGVGTTLPESRLSETSLK